MHTSDQNEIVRVLSALPPEQVRQVLDFALFLASRYGQKPIDESWTWTEEDMRDFTRASMIHAEESIPGLLEMD
jgi:hypothetical protein